MSAPSDERPMKRFGKIARLLVPLILACALGWAGWFVWEGWAYFVTDDAQVTADMITLTPEVVGPLKEWKVKEGDEVSLGQVLGRQEVSMLVSSSALSAQALATTADALARKVELRSPLNGKVVRSSVVEGQVVSPGMELAILADTSHIYVKAHVEETDIFRIHPGQRVDVDIDAWPSRRFHGYVESVGEATQQAFNTFPSLNTSGDFAKVTQLVPVKISIADLNDTPVLPGMNVTVSIRTNG